MDLGQRLRQVRLEAGLTQRQVCGDLITRNMLSQIENGTAQPSMETLRYLAEQLGKPISYFLDGQSATMNQAVIERARSAFADGDYKQVLDCLSQFQLNDPVFDWEMHLLEAQSCIELAAQAIQENRFPYARELLERAGQAGNQTPYFNEATKRQRLLLLCQAASTSVSLPPDDEALMIRAKIALDEGNYLRTQQYLDAVEDRSSPDWHYFQGRVHLANQNYADALTCLKTAEEAHPKDCAAMLEQCYRELDDYKNAYFYACKLRTLTNE